MFKSTKSAEEFDQFYKDHHHDQKISESDEDEIEDLAQRRNLVTSSDSETRIIRKNKQNKKWRYCVGIQNCFMFCFPKKSDQEHLLQNEMEINLKYLLNTPIIKRE